MPTIKIESPGKRPAGTWSPLGLGFRPFFLLAGIAACALIADWLLAWQGQLSTPASYYGTVVWHAHEMLFGYVVAVIAGFLLTAVRNWTGQPTLSGWPLGALAGLWLAGRMLPWLQPIPQWMVAAVDIAFLPALAITLVKPLWAGSNRTNRWFVALLLGMASANALIHAEPLSISKGAANIGISVMLDLVVVLLIFVGGRVMPFFTEKAVVGATPRRYVLIERLSIALPLGMAGLHLLQAPAVAVGALTVTAGLAQVVRCLGWHHRGVWRLPILWVLYTGYTWLAIGLIWLGLSEFGLTLRSPAVHALTVGAIGVFTLGMMARVALGHTGRLMRAPLPMTLAFVAVNGAAVARTLGPLTLPDWYPRWVDLAGGLWVLAFALFVVYYAPILLKARIDGRADQ